LSDADLEGALEARHPDNFHKHAVMLAVTGVTIRDGKVLLVRDTHGFWAGVGGWIEPGEDPEAALTREVREELGVEAEVTRAFRPHLVWNVERASEPTSFLLLIYGLRLKSDDFTLLAEELTDAKWAAPEEWDDLEMLPYVRDVFNRRIDEWLAG
jgi:8-oxo-dGTP pyrophosphatase MutT (NUDIX family)